jgi:hypothetical protein
VSHLRKNWIAGLAAAGLLLAAAPSPTFATEPSLLHPHDRDRRVTTPFHTPADLDLTRKIRNALVSSDALTTLGKNVVIDTRDGNVTLSGTVTTLRERTIVGDIAARVAGQGRVTNDIEFLYVSTMG